MGFLLIVDGEVLFILVINMRFFIKLKIRVLFLGIYLRGIILGFYSNFCMWMFIVLLFKIDKKGDEFR